MTSNEDKIQRLKTLVDELAAAGIDAAAEAQKLVREQPKTPMHKGQEIKVGDWFVWTDVVQCAIPDYGPVVSIERGMIRIRGKRHCANWGFDTDVGKLHRIAPKPEVEGYKVLEPRDVRKGDTYWGTDGAVHVMRGTGAPGHPRWVLEKIQPKLLASDGKELKVGDWVSWDVEVACAEPDYGPVVYAEDGEVRVARQRCGCAGYFSDYNVPKLNRIPAKPEPVPGYKILEPGYAKCGQWWANGPFGPVQATSDYDKHPRNIRWILEPEPKYRPFKNGAEAVPRLPDSLKRGDVSYRWAVWSNSYAILFRGFDVIEADTGDIVNWETLFETCTFTDGQPAGVRL